MTAMESMAPPIVTVASAATAAAMAATMASDGGNAAASCAAGVGAAGSRASATDARGTAGSKEERHRELRTAVSELEAIDDKIRDIRAELQQFEARRDVLARRVAELQEVEEERPEPEERPRNASASLENFYLDDNAEDEATVVSSSPMVFELGAQEDSPQGDRSNATPRSAPLLAPRQIEDWEQGLESIGVAKCGVCGMKFPLDKETIEEHCLTGCSGIRQDGRVTTKADIVTLIPSTPRAKQVPHDRAAKLRGKLASMH
mmetsp:Transcript_102643/g.290622  ORF Transcript_102643/g.290622 Transcript_102643/m.290622 type:complete len:261 (+) Transcript_102643:109-891(+)